MTTFIALLRGVNVVGRNKVPMADLRKLVERLGGDDVQTYIASGNLVFGMHGAPTAVASQLEGAIATRFKLEIPLILRSATQWAKYAPSNPFPTAEPKKLHLCLSKAKPKKDAVAGLLERAVGGERIQLVGDALWVDYASGVGGSKVSPALLDRMVGSPVTARNWNTVQKLAQMAGV
jgi:uncharacterized protein (DUF1697 family)